MQTFSGGISTTSETDSGALIVQGNTTLGTNSSNTLTVNSSATFNQPPSMSGANITSNTIPPTCIVGGVGSSYANISKTNKTYTFPRTNNNFIIGNAMESLTLTGPVGSVFLLTCNYAWRPYPDCPQCYAGMIGLSQNSTVADGNSNITLSTTGTDFLTVNTLSGIGANLSSSGYGWNYPLVTLFVTTSTNQIIYFNTRMQFTNGLDVNKDIMINYNFYAQRFA